MLVGLEQPAAIDVRRHLDMLTGRVPAIADVSTLVCDEVPPSRFELLSVEAMRTVANLVCDRAAAILHSNNLLLPITVSNAPDTLFELTVDRNDAFCTFQQPLEQRIAIFLLQLAERPCELLINWLASKQACWMQDLAYRWARVEMYLSGRSKGIDRHVRVMRSARAKLPVAVSGSATEQNQLVSEYLRILLLEKYESIGTVPELILHHDFDDSLTVKFDDYKHEIPCRNLMTLSRRCFDRGGLNAARVRVTLLASLMEHPLFASQLRKQLMKSVSLTSLLPGARELLNQDQDMVQHRILSANFSCNVRANLDAKLTRQLKVTALAGDSYRGPEKLLHVIEAIANRPDAIHLVIDDGDSRFVDSICKQNNSKIPCAEPRLEDLAILCCRARIDGARGYLMHDALTAQGILHGVYFGNYDLISSMVHTYKHAARMLPRLCQA